MSAKPSKNALPHGYHLNWYRIERVLGRGGFGITYLAHDTNLDLPVAIKEFLPADIVRREANDSVQVITDRDANSYTDGLARFIREARTLVRFKHPNIVRVLSVFEANATAYMVMEFEQGQDLDKLLQMPGYASEKNLKHLIGPIIDGLSQVHDHGFIHRDIKPANIYVRSDHSPVLLDFGSARPSSGDHTQTLTALVSAGYAPFEQYTGETEEQQGPWTDIYALGAVLYRAISGFAPTSSPRRGAALLNDRPDPLSPAHAIARQPYSHEFLDAIDWALQFKVADRPATLGQWQQALINPSGAPVTGRDVRRASVSDVTARFDASAGTANDEFRSSAEQPAPTSDAATEPPPEIAESGRSEKPANRNGRQQTDWVDPDWDMPTTPARGPVWDEAPATLPTGDQFRSADPPAIAHRAPTRRTAPLIILALTGFGVWWWFEKIRQDEVPPSSSGTDIIVVAEPDNTGTSPADVPGLAAPDAQPAGMPPANAQTVTTPPATTSPNPRYTPTQEASTSTPASPASTRPDPITPRPSAERPGQTAVATGSLPTSTATRSTTPDTTATAALVSTSGAGPGLSPAPTISADTDLASLLPSGTSVTSSGGAIRPEAQTRIASRFHELKQALQDRDQNRVDNLTITSDRTQLFTMLFKRFARLDVKIKDIHYQSANQSMFATLEILKMYRENGDIVIPSPTFSTIPLRADWHDDDWTPIYW